MELKNINQKKKKKKEGATVGLCSSLITKMAYSDKSS